MSLSTDRTMPVIEATFIGDAWIVALPGGREAVCTTQGAVERLVRAEASGSAVRYLHRPTHPAAASVPPSAQPPATR